MVTFETHDCFSGEIQSENDRVADIDFSRVNPATGPVSVRGAEPGDSLMVEILDIRPGPQGVARSVALPEGLGLLEPDRADVAGLLEHGELHLFR